MIHVARRFGALKKWADFGSVSLQKLAKSFEETPIHEEALKEVFTKDLDLERLVSILGEMRRGEVTLQKIETGGNASPVARAGIERMSMKTDLIPPERMRAVLIESAKARLLNETASFLCTNCWSYMEMMKAKDLPDRPKCPKCGSPALGLLKVEEEKVLSMIEKRSQNLTRSEEKLHNQALQTAQLIEKHGKVAAVALCARRIQPSDAKIIFEKESKLNDKFYELVLEAERKAMSKRFW
jgi:ATP-dependent Lhr-like helicase